jgi:hypothetical protein
MISKEIGKCFFEEFYIDSIVALRYDTIEDPHEEHEHDHTPIFNFILKNLDSNTEVTSLQGINASGRVNFIISESRYLS